MLKDEDFNNIKVHIENKYGIKTTMKDVLSYALYPKVFEEYLDYINKNGDFSNLESELFFHGMEEGDTVEVEMYEGKKIIIKLLKILNDDLNNTLIFEVNGFRREIKIEINKSNVVNSNTVKKNMADKNNPLEIGASIPGNVAKILVKEGQKVSKNEKLVIIEAMKMETNINAKVEGIIEKIEVVEGDNVINGELLISLKSN